MTESPSLKLRLLRLRPLCIICARPAEALGIAKELQCDGNLLTGQQIEDVNDEHFFYLGSFEGGGNGKSLEYYITSSLRQGMQSFGTQVSMLLFVLRPRYAIHAGVCAAYNSGGGSELEEAKENGDVIDHKDFMELTDVVFGDKAINYEEGKWATRKDSVLEFLPDYQPVRCTVGGLEAFASNPGKGWHYSDYLTGSAVRGDATKIFEHFHRGAGRNARALDMEASIFLSLCEHFKDYTKVQCLGVIKGVSDYGNKYKGRVADVYTTALTNTARALTEWVQHCLDTLVITDLEGSQPGAVLAIGYYDNLIETVYEILGYGCFVRQYENAMEQISPRKIKGFKAVMPQSLQPDFYLDPSHVSYLKMRYGIRDVELGVGTLQRTLYYKSGYLIDFPQTVSSLHEYHDSADQVQYFHNALAKRNHFVYPRGKPWAENIGWDMFVQWLAHENERENTVEKAKLRKALEERQIQQEEEALSKKFTAATTSLILTSRAKDTPMGIDNATRGRLSWLPWLHAFLFDLRLIMQM